MDYKEESVNPWILQDILVFDTVMAIEVKQKSRRNNAKKSHDGIGSRALSLFGRSKKNKSKLRFTKMPIPLQAYPTKRPTLHNRRYPPNEDDPECFHRAIGPILLLAQFFGILPIYNIRADNLKKIFFRKSEFRVIYSYIVLLGTSFMTSVSIVHLFLTLDATSFQTKGGIADATVGAVFYGNSLVGTFLFLRLCPDWISLQHDWIAMEKIVDKGGRRKSPRLRWRFAIIAGTILSLALIEHVLSVVNNTPYEYLDGSHTLEQFLEVYTKGSHQFIIKHVDYSFPFGVFILFVSRISTFTWNFTDLFIMLVSTGIAERYRSLNNYVTETPTGRLTASDWQNLRERYAVLSALVKKVDSKISGIVLLSFINNIYFICLQLLNGLTPMSAEKPIMNTIYFFGSFMFLIGRTISVTLFAARINDQCKIILPAIYNCPSVDYCVEAQRLQHQIASDDVALTGLNFFSITRNFMLAVAGAIVTYEVVLLQFNVALKN